MKETPRVVGIIGHPLNFTLSPAIHNAEIRRLGLPFVYLPFSVAPEHLHNLLLCMKLTDVEGLNVTTPHKISVCGHVGKIDKDAQRIGAINTIALHGGKYIGYNTDGEGLIRAVGKLLGRPMRGLDVCIIGAGGAARAIAYALCKAGACRISIVNRTAGRARKLAAELAKFFGNVEFRTAGLSAGRLRALFSSTDILVNATAAKVDGLEAVCRSLAYLPKKSVVIDIRYGLKKTHLLKRAETLKLRCTDGIPMLVEQAALSFRLWTGHDMDTAKALKVARNACRVKFNHRW